MVAIHVMMFVRKRASDLPVIIMTAYGDVATARMALKAGSPPPFGSRASRPLLKEARAGGTPALPREGREGGRRR